MRVTFLTRYAERGASSRVRARQFARALAAGGIEATFSPLLSDAYLAARYAGRFAVGETLACYWRRLRCWRSLAAGGLVWIEKELFPFLPYALEAALLDSVRYVVDLDDAVFHSYDLARSPLTRAMLGQKVDRLMAGAALVVAGNDYLARRARAAGQERVEVLPSVIDLARYPEPDLDRRVAGGDAALRVAWIGSPATAHYLELVREPLRRMALSRPVELRVIGADPPSWPGVATIGKTWSSATEAAALSDSDVGIMPLVDSAWERGKCGYKLIQYMACGLPVIASPVGVNATIVDHGVDGFLAASDAQWETSLRTLAGDSALRRSMGRRGRDKAVTRYSLQEVAPRLVALLKEAAR